MKVATRGIGRPLRCFLILICVGGAVFAADKSWMLSLPFDELRFDDWITSWISTESREAKVALQDESAKAPEIQTSLGRWTNRSIFYQPSNGWTLDTARSASMPPSKTNFASAWITQQGSENFATPFRTNYSSSAFFSADFVGPAAPSVPNATTGTNGVWALNASGVWSSSTNWAGGSIADGTGAVADFSQFDLTHNIVVFLDSSRTIGFLEIGDFNGTNTYQISPQSGSTLTFDTGAMTHADLSQVATSAGDTISAPIFFKSELNINNYSTTNEFTIAGNIASSAVNNFQTVSFNPSISGTAGQIRVTGAISNGSTGTIVSVEVNKGTVIFSGANSYTGSTFVSGGTLLVNGNQSNATGFVQVSGAGSVLGGTGTIGGTVFMFGSTITGDTTTTVGTLTMQGSLRLHTGEGSGGTYLANLSGSTSDLLAISNILTLGIDTTLHIDGNADGHTTYVLATFAGLSSEPGENRFGTVIGTPTGYDLVYNATDIELVPIPEPATWIGAALALGAIAFGSRRRLRRAFL